MREREREREREDVFVSSECLIGGGTGPVEEWLRERETCVYVNARKCMMKKAVSERYCTLYCLSEIIGRRECD